MPALKNLVLFVLLYIAVYQQNIFSQTEEDEVINYFQMEPFDDSLFIKIQTEVAIDPPDPKAEIIVDLRDQTNQTVSIKGVVYPFLAFTPETRAKIITYPFKLSLEEKIHYGSVFSRVLERINLSKVVQPPTLAQISSTTYYINPFFQFFGGERFGIPVKRDIGVSFGIGTPYSGALETNFVEGGIHILGFRASAFSHLDALVDIKKSNNHNNIYAPAGYQLGYVVPLGNFLEFSYLDVFYEFSKEQLARYNINDTLGMNPLIVSGSYFNWELRYPFQLFGSSRARVYAARYLNEFHFGIATREMSLAGSIFDFQFDAMTSSKVRQRQYLINIFVQRVFDSWGFSAVGLGPSAVLSKTEDGKFGLIALFVNLRLKLGTSL